VRLPPVKKGMLPAAGWFLEIAADHAQVTGFKLADDGPGYILRLRETAGRKGVARLRSPVLSLAAAWRADGIEDNLDPLAVADRSTEIPLEAHGVSTVRLVFGAGPAAPSRSRLGSGPEPKWQARSKLNPWRGLGAMRQGGFNHTLAYDKRE
jgi:hypothetical protein